MCGWQMICPVLVPGCRSTTSPLRGVFWHWERLLQKGSLMSSISQRPTRLSRWTVGPAILDRGIRVMAPMLLRSYRCCSFYGIIDMKSPRGYVHGCVREQKPILVTDIGYSWISWTFSSRLGSQLYRQRRVRTSCSQLSCRCLSYPILCFIRPVLFRCLCARI